MKKLILALVSIVVISGCASPTKLPDYIQTYPEEISGVVESWGVQAQPTSATLSVWKQEISNSEYALFQIRANLDTYRFALSRDQLEMMIDAINNYQSIARQSINDTGDAVGWLFKTEIKLKRLSEGAKDDRLIVNIVRKRGKPYFVVTFEFWLLSFGGPDSPSGRVYKEVVFSQSGATLLRDTLERIFLSLN